MNRERAEAHLRLLAEAELRRVPALPTGSADRPAYADLSGGCAGNHSGGPASSPRQMTKAPPTTSASERGAELA